MSRGLKNVVIALKHHPARDDEGSQCIEIQGRIY